MPKYTEEERRLSIERRRRKAQRIAAPRFVAQQEHLDEILDPHKHKPTREELEEMREFTFKRWAESDRKANEADAGMFAGQWAQWHEEDDEND